MPRIARVSVTVFRDEEDEQQDDDEDEDDDDGLSSAARHGMSPLTRDSGARYRAPGTGFPSGHDGYLLALFICFCSRCASFQWMFTFTSPGCVSGEEPVAARVHVPFFARQSAPYVDYVELLHMTSCNYETLRLTRARRVTRIHQNIPGFRRWFFFCY